MNGIMIYFLTVCLFIYLIFLLLNVSIDKILSPYILRDNTNFNFFPLVIKKKSKDTLKYAPSLLLVVSNAISRNYKF